MKVGWEKSCVCIELPLASKFVVVEAVKCPSESKIRAYLIVALACLAARLD